MSREIFYPAYYYTKLCKGSSAKESIDDFFSIAPYGKAMDTLQTSYFSLKLLCLTKNDIKPCFSIAVLKDYFFEAFLLTESYMQGALRNELFIAYFVERFDTSTWGNVYWYVLSVLRRILYSIVFFCRRFVDNKLCTTHSTKGAAYCSFHRVLKTTTLRKSYL